MFCKCYIHGAQRKARYHNFFRGGPKTCRINGFYTCILGKWCQIKVNKPNFENTIFRVLHNLSNIATSFAEHLEFLNKTSFRRVIFVLSTMLKSTKVIKDTLHLEKFRCGVFHERSNTFILFAEH